MNIAAFVREDEKSECVREGRKKEKFRSRRGNDPEKLASLLEGFDGGCASVPRVGVPHVGGGQPATPPLQLRR